MLLHLKSNNSSSKQDAKFDGTDGIAKLTFRNGRPFSVIGGSIIRDVLTENINSQQLTQMVAI